MKKSTPKKAAAKKVSVMPKPDFAKAVQVKKLDKATLDVVADLLSDDEAKRQRARASAKALEPAEHGPKVGNRPKVKAVETKAAGMTGFYIPDPTPADKGKKAPGSPSEPAAKKPAAEKKPASTDLAVHVNKTGRVCFGKIAAQRLEGYGYMVITVEGQTVKFVPHSKATEGAVEIRDSGGGRPYVSATKLLKQVGFDGTKPLDLIATPLGDVGLQVKVG